MALGQAKKSDIELQKAEREKAVRDLAEKQVDGNLDMVKMLNTLGARAAAFTIRDQQLGDRHRRAQAEAVGPHDSALSPPALSFAENQSPAKKDPTNHRNLLGGS